MWMRKKQVLFMLEEHIQRPCPNTYNTNSVMLSSMQYPRLTRCMRVRMRVPVKGFELETPSVSQSRKLLQVNSKMPWAASQPRPLKPLRPSDP